jgi:hypothetical protein
MPQSLLWGGSLIRFVRMSDKKHQQETINEIKKILANFGTNGFKD